MMTATYSPDDNKLRLYASGRLDTETFERVKAAGFRWAPMQQLFVAPAWSPAREDLLIELAGEIDDEDRSLVERAEERADRFEGYSERRAADAATAQRAVARIADHIPLGQPILVGHHSERHARRDVERIQNGTRKAVAAWKRSGYWRDRAEGAIRAAKYKERPDVRHRRIKALEAEVRKVARSKAEAESGRAPWAREGLALDEARAIAGRRWISVECDDGRTRSASDLLRDDPPAWPVERVAAAIVEANERAVAHCERWLAHLAGRLEYERAMLAEAGGVVSDRFALAVGGQVLVRGGWLPVLRVNRSGGTVTSVTTPAPAVVHWQKTWTHGVEKIQDYRPPSEGDVAAVKAATKRPPLVNHPGEGFREMTRADWDATPTDYRGTRTVEATATHGARRYRETFRAGGGGLVPVYIIDAKRVDPPPPPRSALDPAGPAGPSAPSALEGAAAAD